MRRLLIVQFLVISTLLNAQSYVDSGIRHFALGEYEEALVDFEEAEEIMSMITESSKAKMHYYRGMIWLQRAEESPGNFAEEDPLKLSYKDLIKVTSMDKTWKPRIQEVYSKLYSLIIAEADTYLKLEKKEAELAGKLRLLDTRIDYLTMAISLDNSSLAVLYAGQSNKQAGDLIFENSSSVVEMQKAKVYYEASLKHYEQARYDDPFSKEIIEDLLLLSRRLADSERVEEYEKLLQLAGG